MCDFLISPLVIFVLADAKDIIDEVDEDIDGDHTEGQVGNIGEILFVFVDYEIMVVFEVSFEFVQIWVLLLCHLCYIYFWVVI